MTEYLILMCVLYHEAFYHECFVLDTVSTLSTCEEAYDMRELVPDHIDFICIRQEVEHEVL